MGDLDRLVERFLAARRIAVWGVGIGGGIDAFLLRRLRRSGAEVVEVNPAFGATPAAAEGSAERAVSLTAVTRPVEAVLAYVDPPQALEAVDDCIAAGVPLVWLHDAMSPGAATAEAVERLRAAGCAVIPGLCPMLFLRPADPAHFCLRWVLRLNGKERRVRHAVERLPDEPLADVPPREEAP